MPIVARRCAIRAALIVNEFHSAAQFGAGRNIRRIRALEFRRTRDFCARADCKAASLSSEVASNRTVEVERFKEREQIVADMAVEVDVPGSYRACRDNFAPPVESDVARPGHQILTDAS